MATTSQIRQQQLSKLKAELANLKKQQSLAKQQSEGGLVKKPNLKSTEGKDLLKKYTEATKLVNAKQAEYNANTKKYTARKQQREENNRILLQGRPAVPPQSSRAGYNGPAPANKVPRHISPFAKRNKMGRYIDPITGLPYPNQ